MPTTRAVHSRVLVVLFLVTANLAYSQGDRPNSKLESEFYPIRANYEELYSIIEQIRSVASSANQNTPDRYAFESLRLQGQELTVEVPDGFTFQDLAGAPEAATDVYYILSHSDGGISNVTIRLSDHQRNISVAGHSREQVEALHGLLNTKLNEHTVTIGGINWQAGMSIFLLLLGALFLSASPAAPTRTTLTVLATSGPLMILAAFMAPWSSWLPGTLIFIEGTSFVHRYSAEISFFGVIAGFVLFFAGILYSEIRSRKVESPSKRESPSEDESNEDGDPKESDQPKPTKRTRKTKKKSS